MDLHNKGHEVGIACIGTFATEDISYPISSTGHLYLNVKSTVTCNSSMLFILHRCLRMDAVKSEVVAEPINCRSMTILHFCPDLGTTYHPYLLS